MAKAERTISTPGFDEAQAPDESPESAGPAPAEDGAPDGSPKDAGAGAASTAPTGPSRVLVLIGVAAFAYALDLVSKIIVAAKLENRRDVDVLGHYLRLRVVRNAGAAFGIGAAYTAVFGCIAVIVVAVIARIARKLYSLSWAIALGLLLGGALGNLTDRIFRSPGVFRGHVVDFIDPVHFAVFNLGDSAIVCGGILIVLLSFLGSSPDGTVHKD